MAFGNASNAAGGGGDGGGDGALLVFMRSSLIGVGICWNHIYFDVDFPIQWHNTIHVESIKCHISRPFVSRDSSRRFGGNANDETPIV